MSPNTYQIWIPPIRKILTDFDIKITKSNTNQITNKQTAHAHGTAAVVKQGRSLIFFVHSVIVPAQWLGLNTGD